MTSIVYGKKITDFTGDQITHETLREVFQEAVRYNQALVQNNLRVAYLFVDPLMKGFEAGNQFYFEVLGCQAITKLNCYRTGCGPVQAASDAKEWIDHGLYDAAFLFGFEPLLSNKKRYGKAAVAEAMDIFSGTGLMECYNGLGEQLCREYGLSREDFRSLADRLYDNYLSTYGKLKDARDATVGDDAGFSGTDTDSGNCGSGASSVTRDRGPSMKDAGASLFCLTDCANPNVDFAGGLLFANDKAADCLEIPKAKRIKVASAKYEMVEASPDPQAVADIAGTRENIFPHVGRMIKAVEEELNICLAEVFRTEDMFMDLYTCYPPIPMGFLLAGGFVKDVNEIPLFLKEREITITGGLSLGRAPWNNPVTGSLVSAYEMLCKEWDSNDISAGEEIRIPSGTGADHEPCRALIHGNGGIGESQGVVVLERP